MNGVLWQVLSVFQLQFPEKPHSYQRPSLRVFALIIRLPVTFLDRSRMLHSVQGIWLGSSPPTGSSLMISTSRGFFIAEICINLYFCMSLQC